MLDKKVYINAGNGSSYVKQDTTIIEKRAPTDDSVKLLNEMQDKALGNIIAKERLECNGFKCEVTIMDDPNMFFEYKVIIRYDLNGRKETFETTVNKDSGVFGNKHEVDAVIAAFAKHLTVTMLARSFSDAFQRYKSYGIGR